MQVLHSDPLLFVVNGLRSVIVAYVLYLKDLKDRSILFILSGYKINFTEYIYSKHQPLTIDNTALLM